MAGPLRSRSSPDATLRYARGCLVRARRGTPSMVRAPLPGGREPASLRPIKPHGRRRNRLTTQAPHPHSDADRRHFGIEPRISLKNSVRRDGAVYQWRKVSPSELSVALVADERFGGATRRAEASWQRSPWATEQSDRP